MDFMSVILTSGVVALLLYLVVTHCTSWPVQHVFKELGLETPPSSKILGHVHEAFKHGVWDVQTHFHNKFKGHKAFGWYDFRTPVIVVRDLDLIKDVLVKHFSHFSDRRVRIEFDPPFKDNLLFMQGEAWKRVRSAVSPTFSSGRIKRMNGHIERNVGSLLRVLDRMQENNEELELKDVMSRFTMDTIASTGFGLEIDTLGDPDNEFSVEAKKFLSPNSLLFFISSVFPPVGKLMKLMGYAFLPQKTMDFFAKVIDGALEVRKESGNAGKMNDFLDLVINLEKEEDENGGISRGVLSRSEIYGQAITFIIAGFDTVSTVLAFTLFLLANHPEYQRRVQEELDQTMEDNVPSHETVHTLTYLDQCISEAMRMFPPGAFVERMSMEDITLHGIKFTKGRVVLVPIYGIHMDPDLWYAPTEFRPQRFDPGVRDAMHQFAYMPFGHGPRNCIGMRLAQLELKIALAAVLKRFDLLPCEKTVYPVKLLKAKTEAKDGLWVKLEQRKQK